MNSSTALSLLAGPPVTLSWSIVISGCQLRAPRAERASRGW